MDTENQVTSMPPQVASKALPLGASATEIRYGGISSAAMSEWKQAMVDKFKFVLGSGLVNLSH